MTRTTSSCAAEAAWIILAAGILVPCAQPVTAAAPNQKAIPHIQVAGLSSADGARVMLINAAGKDCRDSLLLAPGDAGAWILDSAAKTYRTDIGASVAPGCWCSDPEAGFAVLAPGKAVAYYPNLQRFFSRRRDGITITEVRSLLCADRSKDEFVIQMRPRRDVLVKVWTPTERNMPSMARDDIANADWIFDKDLAGITLRPSFRKIDAAQFPKPCGRDDEDCCRTISASDMFDSGAINIYYGSGKDNSTCRDFPAVFIHDMPVLGDAAHELGHSLGLFQSDNEPGRKYSDGHTTGESGFACENVMWEGTHFLKDELSPGQAFWMSQSCSSFLSYSGACLDCQSEAGVPSPCPRFSLGQEAGEKGCAKRTVGTGPSTVLVPRRLHESPASCEVPTSVYDSGSRLEEELSARYGALRKHVLKRPDLALGAVTRSEFLEHWERNFALNLKPESPSAGNRNRGKLEIVPRKLRIFDGMLRNLEDAIRRGQPPPAMKPCKGG